MPVYQRRNCMSIIGKCTALLSTHIVVVCCSLAAKMVLCDSGM